MGTIGCATSEEKYGTKFSLPTHFLIYYKESLLPLSSSDISGIITYIF